MHIDQKYGTMDRVKGLFSRKPAERQFAERQEYAPLSDGPLFAEEGGSFHDGESVEEVPFSWVEYSIFALIGVAMLWAW